MPPTNHFLSKNDCILFSKAHVAIVVVKCFLNPNCSLANKLLSVKCEINLLYMIFSIIFENEGKSDIGR